MIFSQGKCEDCVKLDECSKPVGIMFGFCNTDFEPKRDEARSDDEPKESEEKHEETS